jgi:MFS family permease
LNWSTKWKLVVIFNQAIFVLFSIIPALSIAPVTPIFIQEFGTTPATVSLFLGVCVIVLGYANFIIVPFSNIFGRRAACLITGAIVIGSNIWQTTAKDTGSFFGASALNGLGGAVNESVMVQVIADMFFLHERGQWMGLYFASYFIGLFIGPIIAGDMAQYVGWRNFFWLCTGVSALNFLLLLFLFPQTKFHRPGEKRKVQFSEKALASSSAEVSTPPEGKLNGELAHIDTAEDLGVQLGKGKPRKKQ